MLLLFPAPERALSREDFCCVEGRPALCPDLCWDPWPDLCWVVARSVPCLPLPARSPCWARPEADRSDVPAPPRFSV